MFHIQLQKFYLIRFKRFMPKVGFEQLNEKPNKLMKLWTIKNTNGQSTKICIGLINRYSLWINVDY